MLESNPFRNRSGNHTMYNNSDTSSVFHLNNALKTNPSSTLSHYREKSQDHSRVFNSNLSSDRNVRLHTNSQSYEPYNNFSKWTMPQSNLFHMNPHHPLPQPAINQQKTELIRTQSVNTIQSSHKIHMPTKINNLLENHSQQKDSINPQKINLNSSIEPIKSYQKPEFNEQINNKIDRLQNYLHKIKDQRTKEGNPASKVENSTSKLIENPENYFEKSQQKSKFLTPSVFKELDKLKLELKGMREQAMQVQRRNSISKEKSLKAIEIEPSFNKIKQEMEKLQSLNQKLRPSIERTSQISPRKMGEIQVKKPHQLIQNVHVPRSSLNNFNTIRQEASSSMLVRQNRPIDSKINKPKITFSFAPKK